MSLAKSDVKPSLVKTFWGGILFKAQAAPAATNSMSSHIKPTARKMLFWYQKEREVDEEMELADSEMIVDVNIAPRLLTRAVHCAA
jgi:hypothetical protein